MTVTRTALDELFADNSVISITSPTDLREIIGTEGRVAEYGYTDGEVGLSQSFAWTTDTTTADNGTSHIVANDSPRTGCWKLIQNEIPRVVSIKDFGATGDIDTPCDAAFAAAISACPDGGEIYFPAGAYLLEHTVSFGSTYSRISLRGDGIGSVIFVNPGADQDGIVIGNATYHSGIHLRDLAILGSGNVKRTLVLSMITHLITSNVHVAGGVRAGSDTCEIHMDGIETSELDFRVSNNIVYPEFGWGTGRGHSSNVLIICSSHSNAFNDVRLHVKLEPEADAFCNGVVFESGCAGIVLSGICQSTNNTGAAVRANNVVGLTIKDFWTEGMLGGIKISGGMGCRLDNVQCHRRIDIAGPVHAENCTLYSPYIHPTGNLDIGQNVRFYDDPVYVNWHGWGLSDPYAYAHGVTTGKIHGTGHRYPPFNVDKMPNERVGGNSHSGRNLLQNWNLQRQHYVASGVYLPSDFSVVSGSLYAAGPASVVNGSSFFFTVGHDPLDIKFNTNAKIRQTIPVTGVTDNGVPCLLGETVTWKARVAVVYHGTSGGVNRALNLRLYGHHAAGDILLAKDISPEKVCRVMDETPGNIWDLYSDFCMSAYIPREYEPMAVGDRDMEDPSDNDWILVSGTKAKVTATPYAGTQSLRITSSSGAGFVRAPTDGLHDNGTYRIRIAYRSDATAKFVCRAIDGAGTIVDSYTAPSASGSWAIADFELDVGTTTNGYGCFLEFGGDATGWVEIDEVELYEKFPKITNLYIEADCTAASETIWQSVSLSIGTAAQGDQVGGGAFDGNVQIGSRQLKFGTAAPGSGAHVVGDIVFNSAPNTGGPIGWACSVAGTPGTWVTMGSSVPAYHDTTHSPVALWNFNSTLNDTSGNSRHLTLQAGTTRYMSIFPGLTGAWFDGSTYYRLAHTAALDIVGAMTVEAIITVGGVLAADAYIVSHAAPNGAGESTDNNYLWSMGVQGSVANDFWAFWEYGAGSNVTVDAAVGPAPYTPIHVAMTRSATGVTKFYINGVLMYTSGANTIAEVGASPTQYTTVGANDAGGATFTGGICSLKIIASELTAAQILAEYQRTIGGRL